jgi:hypothetical protein
MFCKTSATLSMSTEVILAICQWPGTLPAKSDGQPNHQEKRMESENEGDSLFG